MEQIAMLTLRPGTLSDAPKMAEIFNHWVRTSTVIFSNHELSADEMAKKLTPIINGGFPFFVATDDNDMVMGYAYAHAYHPDPVYSGSWELTEYLSSNALGNKTGTRLFHALVDECKTRGAHVLISCITAGNEACERMNLSAGFTLSGIIPQAGYKFGLWLDDAIYTKILSDTD